MTFIVSDLIDSGIRADENPIATATNGESWQQPSDAAGFGVAKFKILSNLIASAATTASMTLSATHAADMAAAIDIKTLTGAGAFTLDLAVRMTGISSILTMNGYLIRWAVQAGVDKLHLMKSTNSSAVDIATAVDQEISADDALGISAIGTDIRLWYRSGLAGVWTNLLSAVDNTYATGGKIGLTTNSGNLRLANLIGGDYVAPVIPVSPVIQVRDTDIEKIIKGLL